MSALDYFAEDKDASTSFPNPSRPPSVRSPPLSSHPDPLQAWAERDAARRLTQGAQPHLAPSVQEQGARRATRSVHQPGKASPGMQPNRGPVLPLSPPAHPIAPEVLFQAPPSPNVHVPVWRQEERAAHGRGFATSTRSAAPLRQQQPPGDAKRQLDTAGAEELQMNMEADTFPIVHPDGTVFASSADSPGAPEDKDQPQLHTASLSAVRATRSAAPPLRQQQPPGDAKRQLDTAGTEEVNMEADTFPIVHPDGAVFASPADSLGAPEDKDQQQLHTASLSAVRLQRSSPQSQSSKQGAELVATRQMEEDLNAARKAVMDLREAVRLRDKTIVQKDEALAQTRAKLNAMRPASIQPTRTDFDHIQVIKDLRQVIRMRDKQIEAHELALAKSREELATSADLYAGQSLLAEKLQTQVARLSAELEDTHRTLVEQQKESRRAQMELGEELSHATKRYVENQGELSRMEVELLKLAGTGQKGTAQDEERNERLRSDLHTVQNGLSESEAQRLLLETQNRSLQASLEEMEDRLQKQQQQLDSEAAAILRQPGQAQRSAAPAPSPPASGEHLPDLLVNFKKLQQEFETLKTAHERLLRDLEMVRAQDHTRALGFEDILNENGDLKQQLAVLKEIKESKDAALDSAIRSKKADAEQRQQMMQQLEELYAMHEQKSKELNEIRRVHDERTRRSEPKERQRRNMIVRLDTIKRTAGPLVEELLDFTKTLHDLITFIDAGVKEHADLLVALEDMAAEAETERERRIEAELALQHANNEVSHGMQEMTREIHLIREEQRLLEESKRAETRDEEKKRRQKELAQISSYDGSGYSTSKLENMSPSQAGSGSMVEVHLATTLADLERANDELASLKSFLLLWDRHKGDVDYQDFLSAEISSRQSSISADIKEAFALNKSLKLENAELSAALDRERLTREADTINMEAKMLVSKYINVPAPGDGPVSPPQGYRPILHMAPETSPELQTILHRYSAETVSESASDNEGGANATAAAAATWRDAPIRNGIAHAARRSSLQSIGEQEQFSLDVGFPTLTMAHDNAGAPYGATNPHVSPPALYVTPPGYRQVAEEEV